MYILVSISCKHYSIQVSEKKGFASYGFDHMGVILVDHKDIADLEKAEDIAVECDAEDVSEFEEVNGEKVFKVRLVLVCCC